MIVQTNLCYLPKTLTYGLSELAFCFHGNVLSISPYMPHKFNGKLFDLSRLPEIIVKNIMEHSPIIYFSSIGGRSKVLKVNVL